MSTAVRVELRSPFPGLRPFRDDEEHLFFGRERQVDNMIDKLARARFLAVVGSSGSGKSSLVNCGLRPALYRGLMSKAGTSWRMAQFRPGSNPIRAMARALAAEGVLFTGYRPVGLPLEDILEATLRMSKLGIADAYEQALPDGGANLLVVVDQFEELFRYRRSCASGADAGQEAVAFVNLLLEAKNQTACPIYIVLTMRSDFLGDCAELGGLPEAINEGQYLVPRMSREERRAAIAGPVGVAGGEISPVLVTQLVNDAGDNPDQLSILQHALNRTWMQWQHAGEGEGPMSLEHYESIGTMAHALDQHARKAYGELKTDRERQICERIFKALTDKGTDARGIRRPTSMATLCALTGATVEEITAVIDVFRKPSRSFLMPPLPERLEPDTVIDISHESLMRVWERLKKWADQEARSAQLYRRLADTAALFQAGQAGLARDPELQMALDWAARERPVAAWAERYQPGFEMAMQFLAESKAHRDAERKEAEDRRNREVQHAKRVRVTIGLAGLIAFASGIFAVAEIRARESDRRAAEQAHLADSRKKAIEAVFATQAAAREAQAEARTLEAKLAQTQDPKEMAATRKKLETVQARVVSSAQAADMTSAATAALAADGKLIADPGKLPPGFFDINHGLTVAGTSGAEHPENMFGGGERSNADLDTATFFKDGLPANQLHWIEWRTRDVVHLQSVAVLAAHDNDREIGYKFRRAFKSLKIFARTGKDWTRIAEYVPPLPYGQTFAPYAAGDALAVCLEVTPISAQQFRAEFVQAVDVLGQYSGPRVVRLDGYNSRCGK